MHRRDVLQAFGVAALGSMGLGAAAHDFSKGPVRILTPYDPGSTVDITSRMVAEGLSKRLGQTVIVENRPGGHGSIGMNALLSAPANGYTLLTDTPASAINPSLYKSRYDPAKDLAPVAQLLSLPFAIAVAPSVPAQTIGELVALGKAKPGSLNAAVAGTSTRLAGELFSMQAGVTFMPIPYKGAMSAMQSVMRGETQVVFLDAANLAPFVESGAMRGLLITGDKRWSALSQVPTAREAGYPGFDVGTWFGMFARAGTPQAILDQLNEAIREAMASPALEKYLRQRGAQASQRTSSEFKTFFNQEINRWRDVIVKADIKVE